MTLGRMENWELGNPLTFEMFLARSVLGADAPCSKPNLEEQ